MASYPTSLWVPAHIVQGSTTLAAALLNDAGAEVDAIEAELGVGIQGTAGSLEERLDLFVSNKGGIPHIKICDAADTGERKRCRAGVELIDVDVLTIKSNCAQGTIVFSPPLQATKLNVVAFLEIQSLDSDDLGSSTIPSYVNFVHGSGTTTQFEFIVGSGENAPPPPGSSFILHWFAVEGSFSTPVVLP